VSDVTCTWLQGGPYNDLRIFTVGGLPDRLTIGITELTVYERVRGVEQIDREHIYYPKER
jgi:hypothetical protein